MSLVLRLKRDTNQLEPYCTLGTIALEGADSPVFQTVERPWLAGPPGTVCGRKDQSCIGAGTYQLETRFTEARGVHFMVSNPALGIYRYPSDIPAGAYGRSLVLIHAANWAHELMGCIAPGARRQYMDGELGVADSRQSLRALIMLTEPSAERILEVH